MPSLSDQRLKQDLALLSNPDVKSAFTSREDVLKRLAPYHLLHTEQEARQETVRSEDNIQKIAASAQAALNVFQNRLKKEGGVDQMRLTAEQAFLESLAIRQDQIARQSALQTTAGNAALQFRPTSAQTTAPGSIGATPTAASSSHNPGGVVPGQAAPRPSAPGAGLSGLPSSWVPVASPTNPLQAHPTNPQAGSKIERPLT